MERTEFDGTKVNGCNTHLVVKMDDIRRYLSTDQLYALDGIVRSIESGRMEDGKNPSNTYYICNTDEPYAKDVENIILEGEKEKELGER